VPQQPYVLHHTLEQHPMPPAPAANLGMYDPTVSSPNTGSLSSLPPMSSFANRPPQVSASPFVGTASAAAPPMVSWPGVDIKPDLTSLHFASSTQALDPSQQSQQWSMHRSAPALHPPYGGGEPTKLSNEAHVHAMVSRFVTLPLDAHIPAPPTHPMSLILTGPFLFFVLSLFLHEMTPCLLLEPLKQQQTVPMEGPFEDQMHLLADTNTSEVGDESLQCLPFCYSLLVPSMVAIDCLHLQSLTFLFLPISSRFFTPRVSSTPLSLLSC